MTLKFFLFIVMIKLDVRQCQEIKPPDHDEGVIREIADNSDNKNLSLIFYGVTYFPWRSMNKNCSEISERHVEQDFQFLQTVAKRVQIFDLYCNLTRSIVEIARKYRMGLVLGISAEEEEDEYQRQKKELELLLDDGKINLSHVQAVTVGRTSMATIDLERILNRLQEIELLIENSRFSWIPVTAIIDSADDDPEYEKFRDYFNQTRIKSSRACFRKQTNYNFQVSDDGDYADSRVFSPKNIDKHSCLDTKPIPPHTITRYTEFGYPITCSEINDHPNPSIDINSIFSHNISDFPWETVNCYKRSLRMLIDLYCINKKLLKAELDPSTMVDPKSEYQRKLDNETVKATRRLQGLANYFYHSAFDTPFEYAANDPNSQNGLGDFLTRQPKIPLLVIQHALRLQNGLHCSSERTFNKVTEPPDRDADQSAPYQSVAIGVALVPGLVVFLFLLLFVLYRRHIRTKAGAQNSDLRSLASQNSSSYAQMMVNYLVQGDYIDFSMSSDYKTLPAFVGPEWLIEEGALRFEEIVGEGHFGLVYRAKLQSSDQVLDVAVKKLHVGARNVRKFLTEGIVMKQFRHANVLPLVGISFTKYYLPMIVTPFMGKGNLLSFVKCAENLLTTHKLMSFALQIAEGMAYLHDLRLIHRDLAARNCMLDDTLTIKIADFGLCRDISISKSYQAVRGCEIPLRWMPPETIGRFEWTYQSDVWSYGVVVWELFSHGKQPYSQLPLVELLPFLWNGGRLDKPEECPDSVYDLIKTCWQNDAEQRPNFGQLRELLSALIGKLDMEETQI